MTADDPATREGRASATMILILFVRNNPCLTRKGSIASAMELCSISTNPLKCNGACHPCGYNWNYYPGTLTSKSSNWNSTADQVTVDFAFVEVISATWQG